MFPIVEYHGVAKIGKFAIWQNLVAKIMKNRAKKQHKGHLPAFGLGMFLNNSLRRWYCAHFGG
jgi:hypothetical protein